MLFPSSEFTVTANEIERRALVGRKLELEDLLDDDPFGSKPRGTPDGIEAPPKRKWASNNIKLFI